VAKLCAALGLLVSLAGCATTHRSPIPTVRDVDLARFMGDWYVIAHIPATVEKEAYNGVESFRLEEDGSITTTYTFREGDFGGELETYHPTGFVRDAANRSTWGMQFLWPFEAEYLISYLDAGYTRTIIARNKRDLVWIMARTPTLPDADYERLVAQVAAWGYDVRALRRMPQRW